MQVEHLTLDAILDAAERGKGRDGRRTLFPDKRPGIIYLTDWTKARLKALAKNAGVSQADFLEVLIRRYGIRAGSDILTALGEREHGNGDTSSNPDGEPGGLDPLQAGRT